MSSVLLWRVYWIGPFHRRISALRVTPMQVFYPDLTSRRWGSSCARSYEQDGLSSGGKFENGQFLDRGPTERRRVVVIGFVWIGNEADRVGRNGEANPVSSAVADLTARRVSLISEQ